MVVISGHLWPDFPAEDAGVLERSLYFLGGLGLFRGVGLVVKLPGFVNRASPLATLTKIAGIPATRGLIFNANFDKTGD